MKQKILIMICVMCFLLTACGGNNGNETKNETENGSVQTPGTTPIATPAATNHEHDYVETIIDATCVKEGTKTYVCSTCQDTYSETISKIEHSYVKENEVSATCISNGSITYNCNSCNYTYSEALGATGHSWAPATCATPKTCSACGAIEGTALGHKYSGGKCSVCNATDPKTAEIEKAEEAYTLLLLAEGYSDLFSNMIYSAWYFAIYEAEDYYSASNAISAFAGEVGVEQDLVTAGIDDYLTAIGYEISDISRVAVLRTNSGALHVVHYALENDEGFANAKGCLDKAKSIIQSLDKNYASVNAYSELSLYYSEVSSYYNFCYSPSGSFSQLGNTLNTYRTNCENYRNKCSLYF